MCHRQEVRGQSHSSSLASVQRKHAQLPKFHNSASNIFHYIPQSPANQTTVIFFFLTASKTMRNSTLAIYLCNLIFQNLAPPHGILSTSFSFISTLNSSSKPRSPRPLLRDCAHFCLPLSSSAGTVSFSTHFFFLPNPLSLSLDAPNL